MKVFKEKDKIYKFLLAQLLNHKIVRKESNVIKFLYEYFKVSRIDMTELE